MALNSLRGAKVLVKIGIHRGNRGDPHHAVHLRCVYRLAKPAAFCFVKTACRHPSPKRGLREPPIS